jgi:hypothetical protein
MVKFFLRKIFISFLLFNFVITANIIAQSSLETKLSKIDAKLDNWEHKEAKQIFEELNRIKTPLNKEQKYALDLRQFKIEYFINKSDVNFENVLKRVDEIESFNNLKLEYDYLSFIGEVYKISFNFKNAYSYHRRALKNAEKMKDTSAIVLTC